MSTILRSRESGRVIRFASADGTMGSSLGRQSRQSQARTHHRFAISNRKKKHS